MRLFGARSAAAFAGLFNRAELEQALTELWDVRYVTPQRLLAQVLRAASAHSMFLTKEIAQASPPLLNSGTPFGKDWQASDHPDRWHACGSD
jgi:hypothetical protein